MPIVIWNSAESQAPRHAVTIPADRFQGTALSAAVRYALNEWIVRSILIVLSGNIAAGNAIRALHHNVIPVRIGP